MCVCVYVCVCVCVFVFAENNSCRTTIRTALWCTGEIVICTNCRRRQYLPHGVKKKILTPVWPTHSGKSICVFVCPCVFVRIAKVWINACVRLVFLFVLINLEKQCACECERACVHMPIWLLVYLSVCLFTLLSSYIPFSFNCIYHFWLSDYRLFIGARIPHPGWGWNRTEAKEYDPMSVNSGCHGNLRRAKMRLMNLQRCMAFAFEADIITAYHFVCARFPLFYLLLNRATFSTSLLSLLRDILLISKIVNVTFLKCALLLFDLGRLRK